ncbi:MAG: radical SAM protein [Anaerolineales bacterium]|nr:radical SAM protein [Anaerolineales bacterium]
MTLTGLHLLLTYQCTFECDHCFVWGSPWQSGTMTLHDIQHILEEGKSLGTVNSIYFEGGEPFLYYATLVKGVRIAKEMGYSVGIVTNGYWATSVEDAHNWLEPFVGLIDDLSMSDDPYHWGSEGGENVAFAKTAVSQLNIPMGTIAVAQPEATNAVKGVGQLPLGESSVMYRGRAAEVLASRADKYHWEQFTACPYENLRDPGRVHVDPLGYLHLCQGISMGNIFETPLREIVARFDPDNHPIAGPLLQEGPAGLVRRYSLPHDEQYADACHLCFQTRQALRPQFPDVLTPDQMYMVP